MTSHTSQTNLTKPAAAAPPKQSSSNPVRQLSAGVPKANAPTKTPNTTSLHNTLTAPPKMAPAPVRTPAPTPSIPSGNTQPPSNQRLNASDPVQKLAQIVANSLSRDGTSVQQWMDVFRRNEIETVGDLTALRPDDWPRLGLPLRIERAMRDVLSGMYCQHQI